MPAFPRRALGRTTIARDGTHQVFLQVLGCHTNASVRDDDHTTGPIFVFHSLDSDIEVVTAIPDSLVSQRGKPQLFESIVGVGNQFPQKDLSGALSGRSPERELLDALVRVETTRNKSLSSSKGGGYLPVYDDLSQTRNITLSKALSTIRTGTNQKRIPDSRGAL